MADITCTVSETSAGCCPVVEFVGSSSLNPESGRTQRTYRIHGATTIDDAEVAACLHIPQRLPGKYVEGPTLGVRNACDEVVSEFAGQTRPSEDNDGNPIQVPVAIGDVLRRCVWPDRYLSGLDIRAGAEQKKGHWLAIADYEGCVEDGFELSFSTGGQTKHIKYAQLIGGCTVGTGTGGGPVVVEGIPPCNFGDAINVAHDGSIGGCDVPAPVGRFRLTKCYPPNFMTCELYRDIVRNLGCTNSQPWGTE